MCIITEDDVVIPALFVDNVEKLIETAPKSWECLQISNNNVKQLLTLFNFNYLKNQLWVPWHANHWSTTLYIMNRKGMGKLLNTYYSDHIDFSSCKMKPVADIVMFSTIETFTITYPMIHALDKNSTIHPTHVEGHSKCTAYIKKIMNEYQLKEHCAKSIYKEVTNSDSLQTISVSAFRNLSIDHLCVNCKEISCFLFSFRT